MHENQKKKYLVIGTGALGGFYGAKLANAGFEVHFLVRSDYKYIKLNGLKVKSYSGDISLDSVNCYNNSSDMPKGDVILIATKAFSNDELEKIISTLLKDSSIVVLLQNGLGGEDYLTDFIDNTRIFGGLSILAVSKDGPGLIHHHDFGSIKVGQHNPDGLPRKISSELQGFVGDLIQAGVSASTVSDLMQARWEKLVWNIPFSGLSVLLNADTRKIASNQCSLSLAGEIIKDVAKAAAACGKHIPESFQRQMIEITIKMTPYFPSMKLDFDSGKQLEVEAIFGNPLRASQKAGYAAPYISMLYHAIKFMTSNRK
jgi:2-dehydropantoate 2-reductase